MSFLEHMLPHKDVLGADERRFLHDANWWVGLGNFEQAIEELNKIKPTLRLHPDVLCVRWKVYSSAERWELAAETAKALCEQEPTTEVGWVLLARSLHKQGRTREACNTLLTIAEKFPNKPLIHYDLARFSCQMGDLSEAWRWLERVLDDKATEETILVALQDPDLKPLLS
jgi:tetratricopeptide (TPR) repeat protein